MYYCRGCFNTLYFSKMCPKFRATPLYCNMDSLVFVTILWMPIPSFDEILNANKDVLKRLKEKGD